MTEYGLVIHLTRPIAAPTVGALYELVRSASTAQRPSSDRLRCPHNGPPPEIGAVNALARLQLTARRRGGS